MINDIIKSNITIIQLMTSYFTKVYLMLDMC